MKNFKKILAISFIMLFIFGLTSCTNKWIPLVQGSHVSQMPYENIEGYEIEKYSSFADFKKTDLASYKFISAKSAKEERYSQEFFKENNLLVVKFNNIKGTEFYVLDFVKENNEFVLTLLPIKRITQIQEESSTYYCFVETTQDISSLNVKLEFKDDIIYDSNSYSYITMDNVFVKPDNNFKPTLYKINSKDGINNFVNDNEYLTQQSYIYVLLNSYSNETFENADLVILKTASSDFEKNHLVYANGSLGLTTIHTNHYMYPNETEQVKFSVCLIPKNSQIDGLIVDKYFEYEDDLSSKYIKKTYSIEKLQESPNCSIFNLNSND